MHEHPTQRRLAGHRRVRRITAALAVAGTVGAGAIGLVLADGTGHAQQPAGSDRTGAGTTHDRLTPPSQAPDPGTGGQSHVGSGGS